MHVHVVDDEADLRTMLTVVLQRAGHEVTCFATAQEFLDAVPDLPLGCVLLDLYLPDLNGLEVQARLGEMGSGQAVVLLTGMGEVPDAVEAMRAGALDFLRKPFRQAALNKAIERAEASVEAFVAASKRDERFSVLDKLSPREREVLAQLASGRQSKVVAYEIGISVRTVEMHRANILKKLGVPNTGAALLLAQEGGLLDGKRR